jgi:hypothetical protein
MKMTKVEIDGKTYCVETLIYTVERLTKDVKASAEHHRQVLKQIKEEIEQVEINGHIRDVECFRAGINTALNVVDKYVAESGDK